MVYFRCTSSGSGKGNTVIVTCAEQFAGVAITIAKIGKSYTKVCPLSAPYVVKFYGVEAGTYTVSATVSGQTYSAEVVVQDVSCVLNYGFSWKTWVDTASQLDSTDYASLSEVLADEEAVRELFLEHACVDYMADSTSSNADLETIIDNDLCAKWINNSDYALDFLGANTAIKALMDAADKYGYGEWVNNNGTWGSKGNVPVMTANTSPYGEVSGSAIYSNYYLYYAFDGNENTKYVTTTANGYIQYKFTNPVCVKKFKLTDVETYYIKNGATIKGSNDGSTWETIYTFANKSGNVTNAYYDCSDNDKYFLYYRLTNSSNIDTQIVTLQFYGRSLSVSVPTMTSNTAPFGEVVASSFYDNNTAYAPYLAFDNDLSNNGWLYAISDTTRRLAYKFSSKVCCRAVRIGLSKFGSVATDAYIEGSDDNLNWTSIQTVSCTANSDKIYDINSAVGYKYIGVRIQSTDYSARGIELQFYCEDYSEKEFEVGTTKKWLYDHGVELETLVMEKGSSGGVIPVNNGSSIELESGSVSSSFSRVGVLYDLSNFGLIRAKIGKFITVGNNSVAIEVENTNHTSELAVRYINNANDLPNNEYLDISNINQQCYAEFLCGSAKSAKAELTELWLE